MSRDAKNLNPFLEVLVDKLLEISSSHLYDDHRGAPFQEKASTLLHILDYPGIGKVKGWWVQVEFRGVPFVICRVRAAQDLIYG